MPNVFISYVRENAALVDRLAGELQAHGVTVWLDRDKIMPGQFWQDAIRQAIREGDYFIACFSAEYVARHRSYMNTEIGLAIEILQEMPADRIWFIPVLLSECEVPDRSIGGGQTLRDLHWEPLYKNWARSIRRISKAMGVEKLDVLTISTPLRLELVRVPAGEFLMGSDPVKDKGAFVDEKPQHRLFLPEFYIGKYPVTVSQFAVFAQAQNYQTEAEREGWGAIWTGKEWKQENGASWSHPRGPKSDVDVKGDHPVTQVTWRDVRAFCAWVSETSGGEIRLASEANWERAARGVDGRVYPWGNQAPSVELCNFNQNVGDTTPVGRYSQSASPYGALDMAGNVWEWTSSLHRPYSYNLTDGREDESGSGPRVVRGGSYRYFDKDVRCAFRLRRGPLNRYDNLGFRVVCVSAPS